VGTRYAAQVGSWTGAAFVRLDLTISGAGEQPTVLRTDDGMMRLARGCTKVVLSVPPGTSLHEVARMVAPADALRAIFVEGRDQGRFAAFSPTAPPIMNDVTAVSEPLELVIICTRPSTRPALPLPA
jgi:hypothetical protein